mmetsp:Transcript_36502/g.91041  ORF Transcript_36502/g.91041 Transcript_36502/m.91041 type:complete len:212 (+) Transcript_36502:1172-1807(+)
MAGISIVRDALVGPGLAAGASAARAVPAARCTTGSWYDSTVFHCGSHCSARSLASRCRSAVRNFVRGCAVRANEPFSTHISESSIRSAQASTELSPAMHCKAVHTAQSPACVTTILECSLASPSVNAPAASSSPKSRDLTTDPSWKLRSVLGRRASSGPRLRPYVRGAGRLATSGVRLGVTGDCMSARGGGVLTVWLRPAKVGFLAVWNAS